MLKPDPVFAGDSGDGDGIFYLLFFSVAFFPSLSGFFLLSLLIDYAHFSPTLSLRQGRKCGREESEGNAVRPPGSTPPAAGGERKKYEPGLPTWIPRLLLSQLLSRLAFTESPVRLRLGWRRDCGEVLREVSRRCVRDKMLMRKEIGVVYPIHAVHLEVSDLRVNASKGYFPNLWLEVSAITAMTTNLDLMREKQLETGSYCRYWWYFACITCKPNSSCM